MKTPGDLLYDRAWKSILAALETLFKTQSEGLRKGGATPEQIMLNGTRTICVVTIDMARMSLVAACSREPTADELRAFFNAAVDLYVREKLSH